MTEAIRIKGMPLGFMAEDCSILQFEFSREDGGEPIRIEMDADVFRVELEKLNQMGSQLTMKTGTTTGHYAVNASPVRRMMADTPIGAPIVLIGMRTDVHTMHFSATPEECAELRRQLKPAIEKARRNQRQTYS